MGMYLSTSPSATFNMPAERVTTIPSGSDYIPDETIITPVNPATETINWRPAVLGINTSYWSQVQTTGRNIRLYEMNGPLSTAEPVRDNIEKLLESMGQAELVWSSGQYSLTLHYPYVFSSAQTYAEDDEVQFEFPSGNYDLYRRTSDALTLATPLPHLIPEGGSFGGWARDVIAAYITDDHLLLGERVSISVPSAQTRLNFATVKFLNESKDFAEDTMSWPTKLGVVGGKCVDRGAWAAYTLYDVSDLVTYGGTKYQLQTGYGYASSAAPSNDPSWIIYNSNSVYAEYLAEDNGIPLETEFFEVGCSTPYHAAAKAEQRVRSSRMATVYVLPVSRELFYLEPGDLIQVKSESLGINGEIMQIEEMRSLSTQAFEITATTYRAEVLAWNANDHEAVHIKNLYDVYVAQALDLTFTATPEDTYGGVLKWKGSPDNLVTSYEIRYTTNASINDKTVWISLGKTSDLEFKIPPVFSKSIQIAVIASTATGRTAPRDSPEARSKWPVIYVGYENFSPPVIEKLWFTEENGFLRLNWKMPSKRIKKVVIFEGDKPIISTSEAFLDIYKAKAGTHVFRTRTWTDAGLYSPFKEFPMVVPTTPKLTSLTLVEESGYLRLVWPNMGPRAYTYEIRKGASWESGDLVCLKTETLHPLDYLAEGWHTFWVKITARYGVESEIVSFAIENVVPVVTDLDFVEDGGKLYLTFTDIGSKAERYTIVNTTLDKVISTTRANRIEIPFITRGTYQLSVVAHAKYGAKSDVATFTLTTPETPMVSGIGFAKGAGGAVFSWTHPGQRVQTFEVRLGEVWELAEVIGTTRDSAITYGFMKAAGYHVMCQSTSPYGVVSDVRHVDFVVAPPADLYNFLINGKDIAADFEADLWFDRFEVKYNPGMSTDWYAAFPLHLCTSLPTSVQALPSGVATLLIRAFDKANNMSIGAGVIHMNLGDPYIDNVLETVSIDFANTRTTNINKNTNLIAYSESFDAAGWNRSGGAYACAVTPNAVLGPDGVQTADAFYPTVSAVAYYTGRYQQLTLGRTYFHAVVFKDMPGASSLPRLVLHWTAHGGTGYQIQYHRVTDTVDVGSTTAAGLLSYGRELLPDGYIRLWAVATCTLQQPVPSWTTLFWPCVTDGYSADPIGTGYYLANMQTSEANEWQPYTRATTTAVTAPLVQTLPRDVFFGEGLQLFYEDESSDFFKDGVYGAAEILTPQYVFSNIRPGSRAIPVLVSSGEHVVLSFREIETGLLFDDDNLSFYGPSNEPFFGTSVEGPWQPFSEIVLKDTAYEFRVAIRDSVYWTTVNSLNIIIDAPDIVEYLSDVAIPSSGYILVPDKIYNLKNVQVTLQSMSSGAVNIILDKTVPSAQEIFAINSAGAPVSGARADIVMKGY